jgi:hypothetical protein
LNFRITEEEVKQLGGVADAVKLPDGGYLANLNVHHELHCLVGTTPDLLSVLLTSSRTDETPLESLPGILLPGRNTRNAGSE